MHRAARRADAELGWSYFSNKLTGLREFPLRNQQVMLDEFLRPSLFCRSLSRNMFSRRKRTISQRKYDQPNERNLAKSLSAEKVRKDAKDILLMEAVRILGDEIDVTRAGANSSTVRSSDIFMRLLTVAL